MGYPYENCEFLKSAQMLKQCPSDIGREVAFAGRSNAGKSSALNTITQQKKLARISKTPGRTQLMNYFTFGADDRYLVDLPGYGFAKVAKKVKDEWNKHLANYLEKRRSLVALVILMDIRHPLKDHDMEMIQWAITSELPLRLVLTKSDKFKRGPAQSTLLKVKKQFKDYEFVTVQTFSSLNEDGVKELRAFLDQNLYLDETPAYVEPEQENIPEGKK
ncbi:MAG: YihA family ribosome biogenesis GTP-binding protein [Saccharospirillaceae bacterium]|nr:ribosome biogenesis GTP-binding protein YihA/YsxC [Pseudomonadales bacterium]NRB79473.1 YihA family ribosome biogenesis GTP-binding protein [Saccharospirillaceae bacterium]